MSKVNIKVSLTCNESIIYNNREFIGIKVSNEIKYKENDVMVTIKTYNDKIEMQRKSDKYNLNFVFIENKETDAIYELVGYGNIVIKLFTKKLICDNHISTEYYLNEKEEHYNFDLYYYCEVK